MENIVLISEATSFITNSLVQQLEKQGYSIIRVGWDIANAGKSGEAPRAILLCAEKGLVSEMNLLVHFEKGISKENIPVILLGEKEKIEAVEAVISSRFIKMRFYYPINVKEAATEIHEYLQQDQSQIKKKVLVVDDSGAVLRNVKEWLEDKYQVILANSGTLAMKQMETKRPDLVLLDYEMPVYDGKQVLEMIRANPQFSSVPVIFLTGKNDRETVLKVTALKPEGYLLKSQEPSQIVKAVDDFFEQRNARKRKH